MASGSEMEVVLVAQVSSLVKGMQEGAAATQQLLNTIKQMSGGMAAVGQATKPANDAVKSFADTIKNYKADQTQQARTASFFVRELTDITGLSRDAASAVGGLGNVVLEAAAGGGAFAVGFEAAKFVVTQLIAEWRRADEQLKVLQKSMQDVAAATRTAQDAFDKYVNAARTGGDKRFSEVFEAGTKSIKDMEKSLKEFADKGPGWLAILKTGFGDYEAIDEFDRKVQKLNADILRVISNAKALGDNDRNLAGPGTAEGEATFRTEYAAAQTKIANDAAELIKTRQKLIADSFDRLISDVAAKNAKLLEALSKPVANESYDKAKEFREVREPATQMLAEYRMKQPVIDTDFFAKSQVKALEPLKKIQDEMKKTAEIGLTVGDSIGSVFASIGSSIGGAAGEFISQVGAMIAQTIALVLALAFSDTLMTGPLGVFAAIPVAAGILASLVGMIASVPSFEVGTMSVPRTGLAMVHQGEAILPADGTAQAYRLGRPERHREHLRDRRGQLREDAPPERQRAGSGAPRCYQGGKGLDVRPRIPDPAWTQHHGEP